MATNANLWRRIRGISWRWWIGVIAVPILCAVMSIVIPRLLERYSEPSSPGFHEPENGASVPHMCPVEGGLERALSGGHKLRFCVREKMGPEMSGRWHPQDYNTRILDKRGIHWAAVVPVGPADAKAVDPNRSYLIEAYACDAQASGDFDSYLADAKATGNWAGLYNLPAGAVLLDSVEVRRTP